MNKFYPSYAEAMSDRRLFKDFEEEMALRMKFSWVTRFSFFQKLLIYNRSLSFVFNFFQFLMAHFVLFFPGKEKLLMSIYLIGMLPYIVVHALGIIPFLGNIVSLSDDDMDMLGLRKLPVEE